MGVGSWASSPAALKVIQTNRSGDTGIEWAVRRIAHSRGMRCGTVSEIL